jgi:ribose/xylose/arabinose/galactoside ABC-type transport system permease subunit
MLKNMGYIDRSIRVVIGIVAVILALLFVGGAWGIVLWVVAAIALVTAVFGSCIIYRPFGISTCPKK